MYPRFDRGYPVCSACPGWTATDPRPFVLQTSLDDYYVSYELNAYTRAPERMAQIYSHLHQNIQDRFNEAGVEILSPAYAAHRDGSDITVAPADHHHAHSVPAMALGKMALGYPPPLRSMLGKKKQNGSPM